MGKQHHIIRRLIIEVGVPDKESAFDIQNRIGEEFKAKIFSLIEELLDRLSGSLEMIRIEKLEIDIGHLRSSSLEHELAPRVIKEMETAVTKLLHELRNSHGGMAAIQITTSGGHQFTVHATRERKDRSDIEILLHYLETGILPWNGDIQYRPSINEMMAKALEKNSESLRSVLYQRRGNRNVFRRLAIQLRKDQQTYLASVLGCDFASKLAVINNDIAEVIGSLFDLSSPASRTSIEEFLQEEMLYYFSSGKGETASINKIALYIQEMILIAEKTFDFRITSFSPALKKKIRHNVMNTIESLIRGRAEESGEYLIPPKGKELPASDKTRKKTKHSNNLSSLPERKSNPDISTTEEPDHGVYIANAGLVILAPYLPTFFRHMKLVRGNEFVSERSRHKGIHLLQWLVKGDNAEEITEHELLLNKILCGADISEPVPIKMKLTKKDRKDCVDLLNAVVGNWPLIKNTSAAGFQSTFLVKEGKLTRGGEDWSLIIHRDSAVDMLIDRLPWSISMIKLPWNKALIHTQW
jgi:hypothetical protein